MDAATSETTSAVKDLPAPVTGQDIAPDGDMVLVVGREKARLMLRVQFQCLRAASKVFGSMFGPNWSEGQVLSPNCPREVPLDDDNASAMHTICLVLHHHAEVPEVLTARELATIAVASDKYDLAVALRHVSTFWLKQDKSFGLVEMGHRLVAALLFNNSTIFEGCTTDLITYWNDSYQSLLDDDMTRQFISFDAMCKLLVHILAVTYTTEFRADFHRPAGAAPHPDAAGSSRLPQDCVHMALSPR